MVFYHHRRTKPTHKQVKRLGAWNSIKNTFTATFFWSLWEYENILGICNLQVQERVLDFDSSARTRKTKREESALRSRENDKEKETTHSHISLLEDRTYLPHVLLPKPLRIYCHKSRVINLSKQQHREVGNAEYRDGERSSDMPISKSFSKASFDAKKKKQYYLYSDQRKHIWFVNTLLARLVNHISDLKSVTYLIHIYRKK